MTGWPALALAIALPAAGAGATPPTVAVEQLSGSARDATVGQARQTSDRTGAAQLTARGPQPAAPQLVRREAGGPGVAQLPGGPRSAQAGEPLTSRAEGRRTQAERIGGHDRCDPKAKPPRDGSLCATVIEQRAEDYRRPSPTELSPEQKLLADRRLAAEKKQGDRLIRDIGRDPAAGDEDTQAIASVVLGTAPASPSPPPQEAPPTLPEGALGDLVGAIIVPGSSPP